MNDPTSRVRPRTPVSDLVWLLVACAGFGLMLAAIFAGHIWLWVGR